MVQCKTAESRLSVVTSVNTLMDKLQHEQPSCLRELEYRLARLVSGVEGMVT